MSKDISPPANTKINFHASTAFVRKFSIFKRPIKFTSGHRGRRIGLHSGYLIIDQRWSSTKVKQIKK